MYFDGHDRGDVVAARKEYCTLMDELDSQLLMFNRSTPLSNKRPIRVFHDESTFYANADQSFHRADERVQALDQAKVTWPGIDGF